MITRFLLAALGAGLLAGLAVTPLQYARIVPLILHAETFEGAAPHDHAASLRVAGLARPGIASDAPLHLVHTTDQGADEEAGGTIGRLAGTLLANLVTGSGFALLLAAASLLLGVPLTRRNGALWGLTGFAVVALAPALGLAPELPAMPAADLVQRQLWWCAAVGGAAAGAYLLALRPSLPAKAAGVALVLLPHLWGAPQPAALDSPVPATLAAEFAVASLATAGAFWLMLGLLLGLGFDRLRRAA